MSTVYINALGLRCLSSNALRLNCLSTAVVDSDIGSNTFVFESINTLFKVFVFDV